MVHKEIESKNRKVMIFRSKSPIHKGYEYFLLAMLKDAFGNWVIDNNHKQKTEINAEHVATRIANEYIGLYETK